MTTGAKLGLGALTEREKQTLRLIVRGHDAKSIARTLGLSVHTINERLREARRKVAVPSSREAARLLFEAEGAGSVVQHPDSVGDTGLGEAAPGAVAQEGAAPVDGAWRITRRSRITIGALVMTILLSLLALAALPQSGSTPAQAPAAAEAPDPTVVNAARRWLELVDRSDWDASYRETAGSFRKLNTAKVWADTSNRVRVPLGAVISRTLVSQEDMPAPPHGLEVVKFRTRFANRAEAIETVSLDREGGVWRVVGVYIG